MSNFFSGFSLPVILVSIGFAIIPSIFWMILYWGKSEVPVKRATIAFFIGMLSVLPVLLMDHYFEINGWLRALVNGAALTGVLTAIWVGISEEYSKHLSTEVAVGTGSQDFDQIIDGITYSVYAALGFAFIENIKFFIIGFERYGFISVPFAVLFIFRLLGSTLAHTVFSGIYGYYYGKSKFTRYNTKDEKYTRRYGFLMGGLRLRWSRIKHLLGIEHFTNEFRKYVRQEEILAEGLIIAVLIHAMFDFALTMHFAVLVVPMLFIEYSMIMHEFNRKQNREVYVVEKGEKEKHKKLYKDGYKVDNIHLNKLKHIGKHSF